MAKNVSGTLKSKEFGNTKFLGFYQPFKLRKEFVNAHEIIKKRITTKEYLFDVSAEYDQFVGSIYSDEIHVNQAAKVVMGTKIAKIIAELFR